MENTEYVTLKTKTGIDLVGVLLDEKEDYVIVVNPLQVTVDPREGIFARSYLLFSEQNSVCINRSDLMYVQVANGKAIEYYEDFRKNLLSREIESDDEYASDIEDMFQTILDSKTSIKH